MPDGVCKFIKNSRDAKASQVLLTVRSRIDELELAMPTRQPVIANEAAKLNKQTERVNTAPKDKPKKENKQLDGSSSAASHQPANAQSADSVTDDDHHTANSQQPGTGFSKASNLMMMIMTTTTKTIVTMM
jgi:hypothetical protein